MQHHAINAGQFAPSDGRCRDSQIASDCIPPPSFDESIGDCVKFVAKVTLPLKNVSLAEWFNSDKENANDENIKGALCTLLQRKRLIYQ